MESQNEVTPRGIKALRAILRKPLKSDFDVARGISIIEENHIECSDLGSMIAKPIENGVVRIGITGAPGVGKSTFMNTLLVSQNLSDFKVAVIAVDPSSRTTNGAVLGDRIRITQSSVFETVYFRSMATRGTYGGVNSSIESVLLFLANCGFTLIFVETVGVGQNEVEIASCVDWVIHILDSNSGDDIQLEKAGVMEVGDIFFVNQKDNYLNTKFVTSLRSFIANSKNTAVKRPSVVLGSAVSGEGFAEVLGHLSLPGLGHPDRNGEKDND